MPVALGYFHALRCQCATLADAAGVSPRVVQRLMRHSTLELTGRYTRPRAVDIEGAAASLPSLRPDRQRPEAAALAATGTDNAYSHSNSFAHYLPTGGDAKERNLSDSDVKPGTQNPPLMSQKPLENRAWDASGRVVAVSDASSGVRTRTGDLRIMRPPL